MYVYVVLSENLSMNRYYTAVPGCLVELSLHVSLSAPRSSKHDLADPIHGFSEQSWVVLLRLGQKRM